MSDAPLPASLRECRDCGQVQRLPALTRGAVVQCLRCHATLRRTRRDSIGKALAFNVCALVLFAIAASATLLSVSSSGQARVANLFSGPEGLQQNGMWELALLVLFATFGAPLAKLLCTTVVLLGLHLPHPPRVLRRVFAWSARLTPWSMIEVYLLGVFVACVKLAALVRIEVGVALYALAGLLLVMVAGDFLLDRQEVWEAMDRQHVPHGAGAVSALAAAAPGKGVVGCHTCGQLSRVPDAGHAHCPRCGSALHARHPDSIRHTWAFLLAALILYIPANIYPVLNITQLGASEPSTILGGVRELIDGGMWPLALLVFVASIAVPMLKIICMVLLLVLTQRRSTRRLRDRTLL